MLNGWYLLPDIAYSLHTQIAQYRTLDPAISGIFSRFSVVFDPLRARATDSTYLRSHFTQVPVLVIAWLVVAVALLWSKWDRRLRRLVPLLFLLLIALLLLLIDEEVWHRLPSTLSLIQFTFRLQTYIVLTLAGLTIVILRAMREADRRLTRVGPRFGTRGDRPLRSRSGRLAGMELRCLLLPQLASLPG